MKVLELNIQTWNGTILVVITEWDGFDEVTGVYVKCYILEETWKTDLSNNKKYVRC